MRKLRFRMPQGFDRIRLRVETMQTVLESKDERSVLREHQSAPKSMKRTMTDTSIVPSQGVQTLFRDINEPKHASASVPNGTLPEFRLGGA
jgi:hypothetical protein